MASRELDGAGSGGGPPLSRRVTAPPHQGPTSWPLTGGRWGAGTGGDSPVTRPCPARAAGNCVRTPPTAGGTERSEGASGLICLWRNLYAGQEATVRTGHGTTDLFQIGKGVCQGYFGHLMRRADSLEKTLMLGGIGDRRRRGRQSPGALPQRRVVWMWFGAFPGAFGLGRAQPQRRGTSP